MDAAVATVPVPIAPIDGRRKAAILLVSIGQEVAAEVFKHLPEDEIEKVTIEMARARDISADEATAVQREMIETAYARGYMRAGGAAYAREVLERAVGADRADEILARLSTVIEQTPFEFLRDTPPDQIFAFLRLEHPQTVALVLANLPTTDLAANVLQQMAPDLQSQVATRIALLGQVSPDVVKDIASVMREKLQAVLQQDYAAAGGVQSLADVLNSADRGTERNILEHLAESNPKLAEELRSLLFTFEDVIQLDERAMQRVLKEIDSKEIALAVRGASEEVKKYVLGNLSERAREILIEELDLMPPQRRKVIEEAQSKIVAVVRRLEESGEIFIVRGNEHDDELVA